MYKVKIGGKNYPSVSHTPQTLTECDQDRTNDSKGTENWKITHIVIVLLECTLITLLKRHICVFIGEICHRSRLRAIVIVCGYFIWTKSLILRGIAVFFLN